MPETTVPRSGAGNFSGGAKFFKYLERPCGAVSLDSQNSAWPASVSQETD